MDAVDRQILALLVEDGRRTYDDIAGRVSLSGPSVKRRVDRLESAGVLKGYTAVVDPAAMGWGTHAFVDLYCEGRMSAAEVRAAVESHPEVVAAYTVAGEASAMLHVRAEDTPHLEAALERSTSREVFGKPIGANQLIQAKLADMLVEVEKGILLALHLVGGVGDHGHQAGRVQLQHRQRQPLRRARRGRLAQLQAQAFADRAGRLGETVDQLAQLRRHALQHGEQVVQAAVARERHQEVRRHGVEHVDRTVQAGLHEADRRTVLMDVTLPPRADAPSIVARLSELEQVLEVRWGD